MCGESDENTKVLFPDKARLMRTPETSLFVSHRAIEYFNYLYKGSSMQKKVNNDMRANMENNISSS